MRKTGSLTNGAAGILASVAHRATANMVPP